MHTGKAGYLAVPAEMGFAHVKRSFSLEVDERMHVL